MTNENKRMGDMQSGLLKIKIENRKNICVFAIINS